MITATVNFLALVASQMGKHKDSNTVVAVATASNSHNGPLSLFSSPVMNVGTRLQTENSFSGNRLEFPDSPKWSPKLQHRFLRLAQEKALGHLSLEEKVEFEKLAALRRQTNYPQTGEEIVAEYEQRRLTRDLVQTLSKYVEFHQHYSPNNSR